MADEEKPTEETPEKEVPEVEEKPEEEVVEETPAEEPKMDEAADKFVELIATKFVDSQSKMEAKAEKKLEALAVDTKAEKEIPLYTKKDGTKLGMKESTLNGVGAFLKAMFHNDTAGARDAIQKIEPLNEGTAADGGFLVPEEWSNFITQIVEDQAVVRGLARIIPMTTDTLHVPAVATKPRVSWTSELAEKSTTSMVFEEITLTPYKLAAVAILSEELVEDNTYNAVQLVTQGLADSIAIEEDKAFMTGNGTGQPTGIDNYTIPNFSAGGALAFTHINRAYWALPQGHRNKAVWIMNSRTIREVTSLVDSQNRPIYLGAFNAGSTPTLMGRPVYEQNDVASSKIFFGDFSQYLIGQRKGITIRTSTEASVSGDGSLYSLWQRNAMGILAEERVDGELAQTRAFQEITDTGVS